MESNTRLEKIALKIFIIAAIIGGIIFGYITAEIHNFSGIENLKQFQPNLPARLYDIDGELIAELFQEKRDLVSFDKLPKNVINAFLAAEDKDFYKHIGINPAAIVRAFFKNVMAGRVVQGGSTITQQLAKRLFTTGEKSLTRKVLEAVLALQIEKRFSKEEILEMYFNQIYLGHGCYGISSAARLFFNKKVEDLNLAEGSVLAALPSAPNGFSPLSNTHDAYMKNRDTLERMISAGFLTEERAERIYEEFWPQFLDSIKTEFPTKTAFSGNIDNAPYFTDYVRQILLTSFGKDVVYSNGLSVYTTLNLKRQRAAEKYLTEGLERQNQVSSAANRQTSDAVDKELFRIYDSLSGIFNLPEPKVKDDLEAQFNKRMIDDLVDDFEILSLVCDADGPGKAFQSYRSSVTKISSILKVEGALIAVEPSTGYITSMVGGSGFSVDNQYNRAIQARRQVGSAFKPFVYGAAIESKLVNAATTIPDAPILNIDEEGEAWSPGNYKDSFSGLVRIRRALARSINIISIRLFDIIGPERIINFATNALRVPETRFTYNPSLALGVCDITPFEMARAYAVIANGGKDVIPFAIRYVVDRDGNELANTEEDVGNIIAQKELDGTVQVIPEDVNFIMTSLLRSVVDGGTAYNAVRANGKFFKDCAGKTGTTTNWTDAWFCGFTPDITAVVWVGYDRPFMSLGKHQAGASAAAPVWAAYMKDITASSKERHFKGAPYGVYQVEVCSDTGLLPSPMCQETTMEYMLHGSAPVEVCSGNHFKMKSILDRYIEKEGVEIQDDNSQ
ncbi:MAG: PBP1A family penicillin-binding protein [Spirochaetes bacterium]|nr:PBP1A family penicillin-binding protein [Spirochaetota bacterium]